MSGADAIFDQARASVQELTNFDWHQLLKPARAGRWPTSVRLLLLLCTLLMAGLIFAISNSVAPRVSADEYVLAKTLEEKINIQRDQNLFATVQTLESERSSFYWSALLLQGSSEVADITQTMDVVRAAAAASELQLLSVAPELLADNGQAVMTVKARLVLSSLSFFWLLLAEAPINFSISAMALTPTEKPDIFELNLGMVVQAAADVGRPALTLGQAAAEDTFARLSADDAPGHQSPRYNKNQKGFLTRSGSAQFLYLIRDEKGHLTRVEK